MRQIRMPPKKAITDGAPMKKQKAKRSFPFSGPPNEPVKKAKATVTKKAAAKAEMEIVETTTTTTTTTRTISSKASASASVKATKATSKAAPKASATVKASNSKTGPPARAIKAAKAPSTKPAPTTKAAPKSIKAEPKAAKTSKPKGPKAVYSLTVERQWDCWSDPNRQTLGSFTDLQLANANAEYIIVKTAYDVRGMGDLYGAEVKGHALRTVQTATRKVREEYEADGEELDYIGRTDKDGCFDFDCDLGGDGCRVRAYVTKQDILA